jgi:cobalt-zinc-cadmium efflux system outer membrane protein
MTTVSGFGPRRCAWLPYIGVALVVALLSEFSAGQATTQITIDQAIDLAMKNSPTIKATRTQIDQNKAQETTANLRPNPLLSWDTQFLPFFSPGGFTSDNISQTSQFDVGIGYLFERGRKRQNRLKAAQDQTSVTAATVADNERTLKFNVAQQFINALLAKSNLDFAMQDLNTFQQSVNINEERFKAGDISKNDFLKIKVQLLQNQTAVATAKLAKAQALITLRELIGYQSVPRDYDVAGDLEYQRLKSTQDELETMALNERPDLRAAKFGVTAAESQLTLAKANGKQDLNVTFDYSHVAGVSSGSFFFNIPLPIFNRNQGEVARTRFAINQANFTATAAEETVRTDVRNGYEGVEDNAQIVDLYRSGYLDQAKESRDITEFSYRQGASPLLDFLDAERSYRATELAYRQALASYMLAMETLRQAVGVRNIP